MPLRSIVRMMLGNRLSGGRKIAPVRFVPHQLLELKPLQGLDNRCLAHSEAFGQVAISDFLAGRQLVVKHQVADAQVGFAGMAVGVCGVVDSDGGAMCHEVMIPYKIRNLIKYLI